MRQAAAGPLGRLGWGEARAGARPSAHLEGPQPQFEHQTLPLAHVLGGEGEDGVVDPEQRDEQQRGASQPPGDTGRGQNRAWAGLWSRGPYSQVNAGLIPTDVR